MKRLTTRSLIALAVAAMIAIPVDAQTRSGNHSRSGSGGGNSRNNGGSRPTSSMSAPASRARRSGQTGNTKALGSTSRSDKQPAQRSTQPSTYKQQQPTRTQPTRTQPARRQPVQKHSVQGQTSSTQSSRNGQLQMQDRQAPRKVYRDERKTPRHNPAQTGRSVNRDRVRPDRHVYRDVPRQVRVHPRPNRHIERIPPRHRDPMPFGRAVRFWDGGRHYFGYRVSYLPSRYVRRVYNGVPYYVVDGIYYRYYRGHYYVSRPPFGVLVEAALDNLIYDACHFAYYYDTYNTYRTINDNARTIASQNATIAANNATIARQNADIALNSERAAKSYQEADRLGLVQRYADAGEEYFYQDGVFFSKDKNGKYVTIVPPAGALVQELPDDYDIVTLDGEEYYKVDDTVYKLTIIDGAPYFEVLGQLTGSLAQKFDLYESL
ncbi:MAG: hypothetical protein K6E35_06400 [Bacteroidales bacterium]|nr:hypothetical protein [Bacteroidales bacterium]